MFARIIEQDGIQTIAEVVEFDPAAVFMPEIAALFVPATPDMVYMARLIDGEWVAPPPPDPIPDTPPVIDPSTPFFPTLTRKQLRNGLLSIGVTSAEVEAQIGTIADPLEREAALIDWQDTQNYRRDNPLVNQIGAAMGLPPEQIDALWMWAAAQS
ncbi:hypothetical protein [Rhizobium sp. FKY42]|uniref:hypothetical protein n=1 Tax=Rhizobium sp. FKY42 TaxID=2562310 RepID=UPI0010BFD047|nr:hypothetical protein [Rhizobium sp. FKY42]